MLFDQFSEPESLVEFAHQDQAAVGSDAASTNRFASSSSQTFAQKVH